MANNRTLDRALGEVLSEIRKGLAEKIKQAVNEKIESIRKTKGLNKLIDRKNQIRAEIISLEENYFKQKRELPGRIASGLL